MKIAPFILLFVMSLAAGAQPLCSPTYQVVYNVCITPKSPVHVRTIQTDWLLVNRGAKIVSDRLCLDHEDSVRKENPTATNIQFAGGSDNIKTVNSMIRDPLSGVGKVDVYCRYNMDKPVADPITDADCGIKTVTREGCINNMNLAVVESCVSAPSQTDEELWKKAACLIDCYKMAPRIQGMNQHLYGEIRFQLDMLKQSFKASNSENVQNLLSYIDENLPGGKSNTLK